MQYIDKLRFNKAKDLLVSSDYAIKEIVAMAGYVDEANFLRKFKKNEGISPSRYRDIHKDKSCDPEWSPAILAQKDLEDIENLLPDSNISRVNDLINEVLTNPDILDTANWAAL